jgi:hypothetical protein
MESVIAGLSAISVTLGAVTACIVDRRPQQKEAMETLSGFLLIAGFALLGHGLESVFGRP